jgi:hypothetical protein
MSDAQEQRQALIDAMTDQLEHGRAAQRRAAAYFLGEAAAADSIDALVKAYHEDPNKSVRQAAGYALGMFRAFEKGIKSEREDEVYETVRQVEEEGRYGHRAPVGKWLRLILALLLTLIILGALNLFRDRFKVALFPGLARDRVTIARDINRQFTAIKNDVNTLQSQFINVVINGGELDCTAYFNESPPVPALPTMDSLVHADLVALVERANVVQQSLASTKAVFNAACFGTEPLTRERASEVYGAFVPSIQEAGSIDQTLTAVIQNAPTPTPIPPTPVPVTETPIPPTEAPTLEASPALDAQPESVIPTTEGDASSPANPARHLPALFQIVDTVTSTRGASSLLLRYWEDVQQSGSTDGCSAARPTIPDNYVVLPEVDLRASVQLSQAVTLINNGLAALRDGWRDFQTHCDRGDMLSGLEQGYNLARATATSFDSAVRLLDAVRAAPGG